MPKNFFLTLKKYTLYSFHASKININSSFKDLYLTILLILSALIVPKWNFIIKGWTSNPFYIPNVTKIYFFTLLFLLLTYLGLKNLSLIKKKNTFEFFLKILIFIFTTYFVFKWNHLVAKWVEDAILYIPHITKSYLIIIILFSIFFRGIYIPIKRKVKLNFLFPYNWIFVSLIGISLDLIKSPFYIFGSIISPFIKKNEYK